MELGDAYAGSVSDVLSQDEEEVKHEPCYNISYPNKILVNVKENRLYIETDTKFLHSIQILSIFTSEINSSDCELFVAYRIDDCFASDKEIKTLFVKNFIPQLTEILTSNGFSRYAAEEILPMEWALQQIGRARYEAKEIIQEIRNAILTNIVV